MQNQMAQAKVESYNNYYPFGMLMPGRNASSEVYRYGFNGKEMDNDMSKGVTGVTYDYGFRIYDSRIAKFLSVDPLTGSYPWYTPYQFAGNSPISNIDIDGLEDENYLNEFIKDKAKIAVSIAFNYLLNRSIDFAGEIFKSTAKEIETKIKETPYVQDITIAFSEDMIKVGDVEVNVIAAGGVSWSNTLSDNKEKEGIYPHFGLGISVGANSKNRFGYPGFSYTIGIINNLVKSKDYTGFFLDYNGTFCGIGGDYCYWPGGTSAAGFTFNLTDFILAIANEEPNVGGSFRIDYYFMVPDENDPETSWANQLKNLKSEWIRMTKDSREDFKEIDKEIDEFIEKLGKKIKDIDK
jgi:RHS repeat-associated protein